MSTATLPEPIRAPATSLATETLARGVVILLVMTVVQRLLGFVRGMLFCRWLTPEQLGEWDVALGFLMLAAPVAVLGLPGSFGRFVEHYRQRGQLRMFLRRTTLLSISLGSVGVAGVAILRRPVSQLIFGNPDQAELVAWIAAALAALIAHNFLGSLFIAVRMYRVVNTLQFLQSFSFAVLGIAALALWRCSTAGVVAAFGLSCVLSMIGAIVWLVRLWRETSDSAAAVAQTSFWARLVPFALWVWVTNLLANTFEMADRYMLVHWSGWSAEQSLREVGYYHSSRLIPLLFVSVTCMLGALVMPHFSQDWEAGRRQLVAARLSLMLKVLLFALFSAAIAVLALAPLLFEHAFRGKLAGGLAVLPWPLAYCIWFGIIPVAQNYLWCAEKARAGSIAFFLGLVLNIGLNSLLIGPFGLHGAAWSTTAANLLVLLLIYAFSAWSGMRIERGVLLLTFIPLALPLGPLAACGVLLLVVIATFATNTIFTRDDKDQILAAVARYSTRANQLLGWNG